MGAGARAEPGGFLPLIGRRGPIVDADVVKRILPIEDFSEEFPALLEHGIALDENDRAGTDEDDADR